MSDPAIQVKHRIQNRQRIATKMDDAIEKFSRATHPSRTAVYADGNRLKMERLSVVA
jgi:hypothetical protein